MMFTRFLSLFAVAMQRLVVIALLCLAPFLSALAIGPGHSGSWYYPDQSGHGFSIEIGELPDGSPLGVVYWYTYDDQGNPMFMLGTGVPVGDLLAVNFEAPHGMLFGTFDPDSVLREDGGTGLFEFTDEDTATFQYIPSLFTLDHCGHESIASMPLAKLFGIPVAGGGFSFPKGWFTDFEQLGAGPDYTCGAKTDNTVVCWGNADNPATTIQLGICPHPGCGFKQLAAGPDYICAVRTDDYTGQESGDAICWGNPNNPATTIPLGICSYPGCGFKQLAAGPDYICAVKTDDVTGQESGHASCWGNPDNPATNVPANLGYFRQLAAGPDYTCGVKADNTVACWGNPGNPATTIPLGICSYPGCGFKQLAAGPDYICAVKTDDSTGQESGEVNCWGNPDNPAANPPLGLGHVMMEISAGYMHACGLKVDDTVVCWGAPNSPAANPPLGLGHFKQLDSGPDYICGVRTDNNAVCWGVQ